MRRNGKNKEFISLVEVFQGPVYTLCSLLLGDGPAAEQVAQAAFIQAYTLFHQLDQNGITQIWLLRLAYHQCKSWQAFSTVQDNHTDVDDLQISPGKSSSIQNLLAGLKPEERAMIALRYRYRLDLETIAWVIEMNGETLKTRLRKAQKTLAAQYCQEDFRLLGC